MADLEFDFLTVDQRRQMLTERARASEQAYYDNLMNAEAFEAVVAAIPETTDPVSQGGLDSTRTTNLQQAQHWRLQATVEEAKLNVYRAELDKLPVEPPPSADPPVVPPN